MRQQKIAIYLTIIVFLLVVLAIGAVVWNSWNEIPKLRENVWIML